MPSVFHSTPTRSLQVLLLATLFSMVATADDVSLPSAAIPLIFDTDIGNDVDDVLALGMIHALEQRGECKLVAVTITKDHPLAAAFTDAVNTFYGRGEIPIGVCRSKITSSQGRFNGLATQLDGDSLRYPHDLASGEDAPDAIKVLRQTLVKAEDGSVTIVQVGFSTNLAGLLDSPADEISPLPGIDLVKKKVKQLSMMAGAFPAKKNGEDNSRTHREYNVVKDIPAAQTIATSWPTKILWSGYEIGLAVRFPHESIEQDFRYVPHHPLAEAYVAYKPPPHDRPTWDLTSVLQVVRPSRKYFGLSNPGVVQIAEDGLTTFRETDDGKHHFLKLNHDQQIRVIETLVTLSSQPPGR